MRAPERAGSIDHGGGQNPWFAKKFEAYTGTHNIDNGIHGTHFMEVHLFGRETVNFPFRHRNPLEDSQRLLLHPGTQVAPGNQLRDIREIPLLVVALPRMRMSCCMVGMIPLRRVFMPMAIRGRGPKVMVMPMAVIVFAVVVMPMAMIVHVALVGLPSGVRVTMGNTVLGFDVDVELGARNAALGLASGVQVIPLDPKWSEGRFEVGQPDAEVKQSTDKHVPAHSTRQIKIESLHFVSTASALIWLAA